MLSIAAKNKISNIPLNEKILLIITSNENDNTGGLETGNGIKCKGYITVIGKDISKTKIIILQLVIVFR